MVDLNKFKKLMVGSSEIKVLSVRGECDWTLIRFGENTAAMLTPVEVQKLIKELDASIS